MSPNNTYQIDGPIKKIQLQEVEVEISYVKGDQRIYISEQNVILDWIPNEKADPEYLNIARTRVLRQKTQLLGSSGITEGLSFDWNKGGIAFGVQVFSVSEEEAIKVVESMILQ